MGLDLFVYPSGLRLVKRKDLLRAAREIAGDEWLLHREGRSHTVFRVCGRNVTVPRHAEINEITAGAILRDVRRAIEERR